MILLLGLVQSNSPEKPADYILEKRSINTNPNYKSNFTGFQIVCLLL